MIWFDRTKAARSRHFSGLQRLSTRLLTELGSEARPAVGADWSRQARPEDLYLAAEIFAPDERPWFKEILERRPCRMAAVFYDAIPLTHPHITWPHSVARHPAHMKMLARFDLVWAISEDSRERLIGYWKWLGLEELPPVRLLSLGSDTGRHPRKTTTMDKPFMPRPLLLSVGILEPRKNQALLLEACETLWEGGEQFELHLVGRVNPHFGKPMEKAIRRCQRRHPQLRFHRQLDDTGLQALWESAHASLFATQAEGCGLPVLESLWQGVPCLCSDLPVLCENADAGGCLTVATGSVEAWVAAIRRILHDDEKLLRLRSEAISRPLPLWRATAKKILADLSE